MTLVTGGISVDFKDILNTLGITDSYIFPDLEHIAKDVLLRYF